MSIRAAARGPETHRENPRTRRNSGIVELLAGGRDDESPEAADQAVQVAVKASKGHFAVPKKASSAAVYPPQI